MNPAPNQITECTDNSSWIQTFLYCPWCGNELNISFRKLRLLKRGCLHSIETDCSCGNVMVWSYTEQDSYSLKVTIDLSEVKDGAK